MNSTEPQRNRNAGVPYLLLSDGAVGGAAVSCRRLFQGLRATGVDAAWLCAANGGEPDAESASEWPSVAAFLRRRIGSRFSGPTSEKAFHEANLLARVRKRAPRVLNLHNVHDAVRATFPARLPRAIPVVWTLHDMWPLTGGCAYAYECEKYMQGCPPPCPRGDECRRLMDGPADVEWAARERFATDPARRIAWVAPSRWMAGCARQRLGDAARIEVIPYGLNTDLFAPMADRAAARRALGLPDAVPLALTGMDYLPDPRKGLDRLRAAWPAVRAALGDRCALVAFGATHPAAPLPDDWLRVGRIRDERLLNLYYNAADVYVLPSLADNLPNTLLESLAAGTPCVAFDVGGCAEVVRPGATGYLAPAGDATALAHALTEALRAAPAERERMRAACRETALREYRLELQANRYLALFEELASTPGAR